MRQYGSEPCQHMCWSSGAYAVRLPSLPIISSVYSFYVLHGGRRSSVVRQTHGILVFGVSPKTLFVRAYGNTYFVNNVQSTSRHGLGIVNRSYVWTMILTDGCQSPKCLGKIASARPSPMKRSKSYDSWSDTTDSCLSMSFPAPIHELGRTYRLTP